MGDTQWEKLDGRPYTVAAKGRRYQEIAEAIARSTKTLRAIEDEMANTSLALDKTRSLAGEVRESIDKARVRYEQTGEALETYGDSLRAAKYEQADPAAEQLRTLRADLADAVAAQQAAQTAVDDLPDDATPADRTAAERTASSAGTTVSTLAGQVAQYERQWQEGKDAKDAAARTAVGKIDEVVSGRKTNGLEDGFWDKVGEVVSGIVDVLKVVCDIAGILAIFLSWVPILGQVLLVLAAVGAILKVVEATIAAIKGDGSWWAVLGATALAALTLFGGRAISALAKYSKARTVVQSTARMSPRAAKAAFGSSTIKSSRQVFAMSRGQRVTDVLKSPFVRSATDKKVFGLIKGGHYGTAAKTVFPNPFTGGFERWALGNADVGDVLRVQATTGAVVDGVSTATASLAAVGAVGLRSYDITNKSMALGTSLAGNDGWAAANATNSLASRSLDGPYGKLAGAGIKYGSMLAG
ncbi:hypothetical protein [Isoptericola variabilis]|uniref:Uncharacterized protein n=1 Tax=Isoptericola variabilis (strain 225) TaxID=743718 RepID=F6FTA2_ISOV2|nr:hypothetical protein [Isoptericola variabilis]AEG45266.1 hypothetical protein Isova_2562 [Isoptericola variabilis 225]TWH30969.1 hypothetical protein L600_002800000340 [Isoptericola variabilis J7]